MTKTLKLFTENDIQKIEESLKDVMNDGFYVESFSLKTYNLSDKSSFENLSQCINLKITYYSGSEISLLIDSNKLKGHIELLMKFLAIQDRLLELGYNTYIYPKESSIDIEILKNNIKTQQ